MNEESENKNNVVDVRRMPGGSLLTWYATWEPRTGETLLIQGLPGLGDIGTMVAEQIIRSLQAKKLAELRSPFFPGNIPTKRGLMKDWRNTLHHATTKGKEILILTGNAQPLERDRRYTMLCFDLFQSVLKNIGTLIEESTDTDVKTIDILRAAMPWRFAMDVEAVKRIPEPGSEVFQTSADIVELAKLLGTSWICAIGGNQTNDPEVLRNGDVYTAATSNHLLAIATKAGAKPSHTTLPSPGIVGAAGMVPALAQAFGIGGLVLLGSTTGVASDARAAVKTIQILSRMMGISIDHSSLDEKAAEIEKDIIEAIDATEKLRSTAVD